MINKNIVFHIVTMTLIKKDEFHYHHFLSVEVETLSETHVGYCLFSKSRPKDGSTS